MKQTSHTTTFFSRSCLMIPVAGLLLVAVLLTGGCNSNPPPTAKKFDASMTDINKGYGLLYNLVAKNKDVSKILDIKDVTPATEAIIKDISALCKEAQEKLDAFAKADERLGMTDQGLPAFEVKTRDAIESTTTKRLLFSSGDLFELRLLQTQAQSTNYMAHLSLSISVNDDNADRKAALEQISKQADKYYQQVMARLTIIKASDVQEANAKEENSKDE